MTFITSIKSRILSRSAESELKLKLLYWSCWFDSYVKTNKKCFDLWPVKHTCQKRLGFITSDLFYWKLYLLPVCRGCSHSPNPPPSPNLHISGHFRHRQRVGLTCLIFIEADFADIRLGFSVSVFGIYTIWRHLKMEKIQSTELSSRLTSLLHSQGLDDSLSTYVFVD